MNRQTTAQSHQQKPTATPTTSRMLQRKCACGNHTIAGGECSECGKKRLGLQTKLTVNEPGDIYEQEADRIADQVMAAPAHSSVSCAPPRIQRFAVQPTGQTDEAPASVDQALASPGRPLEPPLRQDMEQRFGSDFSRVRVHSGAAAEQSARDVNAHAYTVGHNIVFGAGRFAPGTHQGRRLIAHELTHVVQQGDARVSHSLQRKCQAALGAAEPDCAPSQQSVGGWQFMFKMGCDELLPGEEAKISKLKAGRKLNIHGFASREGDAEFNESLSCHRANIVADLARSRRPDCPVLATHKHGASPPATVAKKDPNLADFWRSVIVEEIRPTREEWLDPTSILSKGWTLYRRASNSPTQASLDAAAAHRADVKTWMEGVPKSVAPAGKDLDRKDLTDYTQLYSSAEFQWKSIDKLLTDHRHTGAKTDTYVQWASGSGTDSGPALHAKHVPAGARYHVDLFGEGFFPGAVNIGMAERTSTTGVSGTRVPNLIYRKFSAKNAAANRLPIEDHIVDLVTSENGPLMLAGLVDEIARIVAPGATIVLYGPDNMEPYHDRVATAVKGAIKKEVKDGAIESIITVPKP